jgi:capsular exopolysaccharide synthesis family protein
MEKNNNNGYYSLNGANNNGSNRRQDTANNWKNEFQGVGYFVRLLWFHKWIVVTAVLVGILLAGLYAFFQTPIYQSDGSIMVTVSNKQHNSSDSEMGDMLAHSYGAGLSGSVADQFQLLESHKLSKLVADTLMERRWMKNGQQYPVLYKSYPDDSTLVTKKAVASRLRKKLVFTQPDNESHLIKISYKSPSPLEAADVVNFIITGYSRFSINRNRQAAGAAIGFLNKEQNRIKSDLHDATQQLQDYMDKNNLTQVDAQTQALISRSAKMKSERQQAKSQLTATNSALGQYQKQLNRIRPELADKFASAFSPNMERLQYKLAELKTNRMLLLSRNPHLKKEGVHSPQLERLDKRIKDFETKIGSATKQLLDKKGLGFIGGAKETTQKLSDLKQNITNLKVKQQQYEAQIKALTGQINRVNKKFNDLPKNMTALARLKQTVQIKRTLYTNVSKQYAQMKLLKQTQFGQGQLLDKANVPSHPVEPNMEIYLFLGLMIGGFFGVGIIFVKEFLNDKIDSTDKLMPLIENGHPNKEIPLLSVVPNMKLKAKGRKKRNKYIKMDNKRVSNDLVSYHTPESIFTDSLRRLESHILLSNQHLNQITIMVTSPTKGEGKTTIAANLGVVMAETARKVLIIDTDLRQHSVNKLFGFKSSPGITDVLLENSHLPEAIKETPVPSLSILPAGQKTSNPSLVLKSNSFKNLINTLKLHYDCIILDTPPFGLIADSAFILNHTTGVVVVTRFNETKKEHLKYTFDQLVKANANIIGTVLNGFNPAKNTANYYGPNYYKQAYEDYETYQSYQADE